MGWLDSFISNPIDTLSGTVDKVVSNPIPAITAAVTQNPYALAAYAAPTSGQLNQGLLGAAQAALQNQSNVAGNISAANASQFRPVGVTNTFGTSGFQYDANGNLTGAGYQLSPQLQGAQNYLMGGIPQNLQDLTNIQAMGRQYMGTSPQVNAENWMQSQRDLLAPSRELETANLMNQMSNSGRTGLKVAQGGNLYMTSPELAALENRRMMEDLQLASRAQEQGRSQYTFGQGLLSSAYDPYNMGLKAAGYTEGLGQQPLDISTTLGAKQSTAGANAAKYLQSAGQTNTTADILGGAGGQALLKSLFGGVTSPVNSITPDALSYYNTQALGLGNTGDLGLVW